MEAVAGLDVHTAVAVVVDPVSDAVETLFAFRMLAIWLSPSTRTRPIPLWRLRPVGDDCPERKGTG